MQKSTVAVTFALIVAFSMSTTFSSVNGLESVSEGSSKTTIALGETVEFWVDVKPTSFIKWYCDDVLVQSEYTTHSNYTFTPKSPGTYYIELSVDGFTKPSGPRKITVLKEPPTPPAPTSNLESFIHFYNDTHFALRQTLWAFDGIHGIATFAATENDYLEFNISTTNADQDRPNDVCAVEFKIESKNHNSSYISGTEFTQKIKLNYTDTYTISFWKHPFFASVYVVGSIDLHRTAKTITPTPANTATLQPTNNPDSQTIQQTEPISILAVVVFGLALLSVAVFSVSLYHKNQKKLTQRLQTYYRQ